MRLPSDFDLGLPLQAILQQLEAQSANAQEVKQPVNCEQRCEGNLD